MKKPNMIRHFTNAMQRAALAAGVAALVALTAGSAHALTTTSVISFSNLAISPGAKISKIAKGTLPAGSILRSVSINATRGGDAYTDEICVWIAESSSSPSGKLRIVNVADYHAPSADTTLGWNWSGSGYANPIIATQSAIPAGIDLHDYAVFLDCDYWDTWTGSITLTYDVAGPPPPTITGAATAAPFTAVYGSASTAQTFGISGANLTTSITATVPSGFEVSANGSTYASTATFTQSSGSASGTLYVRLAATAAVGSYNSQTIVLSSSGATSVNITTAASGNTVSKVTTTINTPPTASAITVGQTLTSSILSGGAATPSGGSFAWTTPATAPPAGTASYEVTYTPTDTAHYTSATRMVSVKVGKANTTALVSSANPAAFGSSVVFTATVQTTAPATPSTVTLYNQNFGSKATADFNESGFSFDYAWGENGVTGGVNFWRWWGPGLINMNGSNLAANGKTWAAGHYVLNLTVVDPGDNYGTAPTLSMVSIAAAADYNSSMTVLTGGSGNVTTANTAYTTSGGNPASTANYPYHQDGVGGTHPVSYTLAFDLAAGNPLIGTYMGIKFDSGDNSGISNLKLDFTGPGSGSGGPITATDAGGTCAFSVDGTVVATNPVTNGLATFTSSTLAVGDHTILASYLGDATYAASSASSTSQSVNKAGQTITFAALAPMTYGAAAFNLTASADSNLTVSFVSSDTSVASISGNTVTILKAGSTTITASQSGNANYNAATNVPRTLTVTAPADPFQAWINANYPTLSDKTSAGDPDGDGMSNKSEYAFGLDPSSGSSCSPIKSPLDKTSGMFTYTRRATPATTGLSYKVWTSSDLSQWTEDVGAVQQLDSTVADVQTVTVTLSAGKPLTASKLFVRVTAN